MTSPPTGMDWSGWKHRPIKSSTPFRRSVRKLREGGGSEDMILFPRSFPLPLFYCSTYFHALSPSLPPFLPAPHPSLFHFFLSTSPISLLPPLNSLSLPPSIPLRLSPLNWARFSSHLCLETILSLYPPPSLFSPYLLGEIFQSLPCVLACDTLPPSVPSSLPPSPSLPPLPPSPRTWQDFSRPSPVPETPSVSPRRHCP